MNPLEQNTVSFPLVNYANYSVFGIALKNGLDLDTTDSIAEVSVLSIFDKDRKHDFFVEKTSFQPGRAHICTILARIDSIENKPGFVLEINFQTTNVAVFTEYKGEEPLHVELEVKRHNENRRQ